ncbi:amidase [Shimia gijangensis]|uniref:Amidase n=1 Tax=Shimia gijangensis TaxID=1470563 RepID=A0A1M6N7K7_9RHOB|nr:amidase [Shimia gijangensis]SHJ91642.1 amidase [Shimia gijangensis]
MNLLDKDAGEILAAMRFGDVTCEEVMAATLARIEAVNGSVNAIVSLRDPEVLMEEARAADAMPPKGLLHGLPFAVKDLARLAGVLCSQGSPLFARNVPEQDETMVARLRAAGAIFLGKTNVPEFGLGSHSYNPIFGVTRNPYDTRSAAGGSSGGAAAALATGMVALADGSDMMGSLRNPAAFCNVYGFRPSWGVVPREPGGETFLQQLSTLGPMARCPADLGLLMSVIAGPNALVPHNATAQDWTVTAPASLEGVRIGWLADWGGAYPVEPGILDLCGAANASLSDLGAEVIDVSPPFEAEALWESWTILRQWAIAAEHGADYDDPEHRSLLKPEAIWEIEQGLALSSRDVSRAGAIRARWFETLSALLEELDALALPSSQVWPFPAEWDWPKTINGTQMDTYHRWMEVVVPVSLAGVPCISVPVGFGDNGLPMGMQLMTRKGRDQELLNWAQCYHNASRWPDKKP